VTQDRWRRLNELFHAALEQPEETRTSFIDAACDGDTALRDEVHSLLLYHDEATSFLEDSPLAASRPPPDAALGGLAPGTHVGQYRIVGKIGQGGMGVVYLADDTRLGRQVAIKALPPQFTLDDRRRERMRREARAAAVLTHPGIATVYALEEFDDHLYIVTEYVPGETLRDELARGRLPIPAVIDTAIDIARALSAAHDQGIVHRDLKPENVIRIPDGGIKILDFGLARFQSGIGLPDSASQLTEMGAILGTPAYMSPEQLRGWQVDRRSDLFSFGVLVYELASGVHPFAGGDPASTIARVLEAEPRELSSINRSVPAELEAVLVKCLRKNREDRYASTRDLLADLEDVRRAALSARSAGSRADAAAGAGTPLWWWQFHQVLVAILEYAMLYPLWHIRNWVGGRTGAVVFFGSLVVVSMAATLRLHLWFTSRHYRSELSDQRAQSEPWIRWPESAFGVLLLVAAFLIEDRHAGMAALLAAIAVGLMVSLAAIEPATTRAAFGRRPDGKTPRPGRDRDRA
jgi:hypothetical protein